MSIEMHPGVEPEHPSATTTPTAGPTPTPFAVFDLLAQPVAVVDAGGALVYSNTAWRTRLGDDLVRPNAQHRTTHLGDLAHPDDRRRLDGLLAEATAGDVRLRDGAGEHRWFEVTIGPAGDGLVAVTATDVHDRLQATHDFAEMLTVRNDMLDASVDCIKIIDTDGIVLHMNQSGCLALGVTDEQAAAGFGMVWLDLLPPEIRTRGERALAQAREGRNARFDGMSIIEGQTPQHWDNILTPVLGLDGRTRAILCVSRDITLQREAERRLRVASETDDLTDLLNRRAFRTRLRRAVTRARTHGEKVGMLLIDLDHFKNVNDTLGHLAGDHLLRVLSRRIKACVPEQAFVGRLGGDEFAVVLPGTDEQALLDVADLVSLQLDAPISHSGRRIDGGMSIGCALYPRDAWDEGGLMASADAALYDLKAAGRGGIRVFNQQMLDAAEAAATQIHRARDLVRDRGILPYYQPKVRLEDGSLVGFEALLRWRSPELGIQPPSTVFEAFKDYELATGMGSQMHERVLADLAAWRDRGLPLVPVSFNAAPVELLRGDYPARLLEKLAAFEISPELIELEITETILLERGAEFVTRALRELKDAGVRIALDDFGTGHSSLAHLRDYPVDTIKVDRSFVARMVTEPSIHAIVRAIAELGPSLGVEVVAEGVETELQRQLLTGNNCHVGQGYLFGAAMSGDAASRILHDPDRTAPRTVARRATARPMRSTPRFTPGTGFGHRSAG